MDQHQIDAIAREIRRYFLERKNAIFNGNFRLPPKYAEFHHWQKAAEQCMELGATPETYVDAAFAHSRLSTGPYPNTMYGTAAKGWYMQYMHGRTDLQTAREVSTAAGRDSEFDTLAGPDVANLRAAIDLAHRSLIRLTGSKDIDDKSRHLLSSYTVGYPCYVRVLLGYKDEQVKKFFGKEAQDFFLTRPGMIRAAEALGYPINEILIWLSAPNL